MDVVAQRILETTIDPDWSSGTVQREDVAVRAVRMAIELFGRLDVLVNNAARTLNRPFTETTARDWAT